jgi:hypothetical protein
MINHEKYRVYSHFIFEFLGYDFLYHTLSIIFFALNPIVKNSGIPQTKFKEANPRQNPAKN